MRHFSQKEQAIIDYICNIDISSGNIAICDMLTHFCHCSFTYGEDSLFLTFNEHKYEEKDILNWVLSVICLLEYLSSKSLIYIFQRNNVANRKEILNKAEGHTSWDNKIVEERKITIDKDIIWNINGKKYIIGNTATGLTSLSTTHIPWNLVEFVDKYAKAVIYCTETLKHIQRQNYKDDSTLQYEKNREQTNKAIRISFGIGIGSILVGIVTGLLTYCQTERHHYEDISQSKKLIIVHDTVIQSVPVLAKSVKETYPDTINDSK